MLGISRKSVSRCIRRGEKRLDNANVPRYKLKTIEDIGVSGPLERAVW